MKLNYYTRDKIKDIYQDPGIYRLFLIKKDTKELVYIGQSINLRNRLMEHNKTVYMEFHYIDYNFCSRNKLDEIEKKELDQFKKINGCWPKYNNQGGNKHVSV